ncbi:MAG: ABC transporter permease [Acidobacteriota bacterium]
MTRTFRRIVKHGSPSEYGIVCFSLSAGFLLLAVLVSGYASSCLPFVGPAGDHLYVIWERDTGNAIDAASLSAGNVYDVQALPWPVKDVAFGIVARPVILSVGDVSSEEQALFISTNFPRLFGYTPLRGRLFDRDIDGDARTSTSILISERLWKRRFAGREDVIGTTVRLGDRPVQIVGVMNEAARWPYPLVANRPDVWTLGGGVLETYPRRFNGYYVFAAVDPSVQQEGVDELLAGLGQRLQAVYPQTNATTTFFAERLDRAVFTRAVPQLTLLLALAVGVLSLAALTIVQFLLAMRIGRSVERRIRTALGARWGHLVRDAFGETAFVTVLAGTVGTFGAFIVLNNQETLERLIGTPVLEKTEFHWSAGVTVGIFVCLLSLVFAFILIGSPRRSATTGTEFVRHSGTHRFQRRAQAIQVVVQVACCTAAVCVWASVASAFATLMSDDAGRVRSGVVVARI